MSKWTPLHVHSDMSLLDGLSKPVQIAKRCKELNYSACALSDHGNCSGVPAFIKACKSNDIKPIGGLEFYLSEQNASVRDKVNAKHSHLVVLAKNLAGWRSLIKATSESNKPEHFYRKPRLSLEQLSSFAQGQWVAFSGHPGSDLGNVIFKDYKAAYAATTYEDARAQVRDDWKAASTQLAGKYEELFGKGNFFLEIQLVDAVNIPAAQVIGHALRIISKKTGIPCLATADSHYVRSDDAQLQRILLCSAFETTLNEVKRKLANEEDVTLGGFFKSNRYHIPSFEELEPLHTPEEIENSLRIAEMCEQYDILSQPRLPQYQCPKDMEANEYIRELCRNGWRKKIEGKVFKSKHAEYADRVKHELQVITEAGLSPYFLIVQDYVNWAKNQGWMVGRGRGSAAGCLVSYLLNITSVDPIEYGLIFERFYNIGRASPGKISLPDIDSDFPISKRELVKDYIRKKYGDDKVAEMVTFSRTQGRGAIKDVLRAHERCSQEEANRITEFIPDESEIADQLQEIRQEGIEPTIIRWALEDHADKLSQWVTLKEDGTLDGPLAFEFGQAMRLEGTKRSQGRHPSGLIVCPDKLSDIVPMVYDKSTEKMVVGVDMHDAEAMGLVKLDILGLGTLDRISDAISLIRTGQMI